MLYTCTHINIANVEVEIMGKIIAIMNQKGGVAKTTTTINLAAGLVELDKKVLVIDLDPQSSLSVAMDMLVDADDSMYAVICEGKDIKEITTNLRHDLDLAASSIDLSAADIKLVNEFAREWVLKKALSTVVEDYDYILIDCQPSLGLLVINAMVAADGIIIPCSTDYLALKGLTLLQSTIDKVKAALNPTIKQIGIVATMYDDRTIHSREVLELLKSEYNIVGTIATSVRVKDALLASQSLLEYDGTHKIAMQYSKLAKMLVDFDWEHGGDKLGK